jgi:hypothetical protein
VLVLFRVNGKGENGMNKVSSLGRSRKKWLLSPLIVGGALLALASPALATPTPLPITPGNTVPIAKANEINYMRHMEELCKQTTNMTLFKGAVKDYEVMGAQVASQIAAAGNTLVVPTIGFYCHKSGVPSNITPGTAYVNVQNGIQMSHLRHDAGTCSITTDLAERKAVILDYNINAFSPGGMQDELIAAGNPAVVPPIHDLCPAAP